MCAQREYRSHCITPPFPSLVKVQNQNEMAAYRSSAQKILRAAIV